MRPKDKLFSQKLTINCNGELLDLSVPRVMGILNITPDSFYDGGKYTHEKDVIKRVSEMLEEGADLIDVGACSSRPGAAGITAAEEMSRLAFALDAIRKEFPKACLSVDTWRPEVAAFAVHTYGVGMINDISAGTMDPEMLPVAATLKVPYVIMHMQGTPENMQKKPHYADVVKEVIAFFAGRIEAARQQGIVDLILDPGFGFGKSIEHNYSLLSGLSLITLLGMPLLVGLSRKSMIYKPLGTDAGEALNGTTVLNTLALANGAAILRVHDVKAAAEAIKLFMIYRSTLGDSD